MTRKSRGLSLPVHAYCQAGGLGHQINVVASFSLRFIFHLINENTERNPVPERKLRNDLTNVTNRRLNGIKLKSFIYYVRVNKGVHMKERNALVGRTLAVTLVIGLLTFGVTAQQIPNHVVISELYVNGDSAVSGNEVSEWLELYNPTENSIDIGNWTFGRTTTTPNEITDGTIPFGTEIGAYSFYLIGDASPLPDNLSWPTPDLVTDIAITNNDGCYWIKNSLGQFIDKVSWDGNNNGEGTPFGTDPAEGNSLERKSLVAGFAPCQDTDDNSDDFEEKDTPTPMNSSSPIMYPAPVELLHNGTRSGYATIQEAINSAAVADTVKVHDGTYTENLEVGVDKVVLMAASSPIIDGGGVDRCIFVNEADSVVIRGFTIQNGTEGILFDRCSGGLVTLNNIKKNVVGGDGRKLPAGTGAGILVDCSDPLIEANDIDSNVVGIMHEVCDIDGIPRPTINFNNIFDNTNYGVQTGIPTKSFQNNIVNAEANYWGAADGPGPVGPGSGDDVSDNVDYEPWFTDTAAIHTVTDGTIDAKSTANVEVDVNGTADVTIGQYSSNPGGAHTFTAFAGGYIDVHIEDTSEVNSITIRFYYPIAVSPEVGLALWWWDGNNWLLCSDQTLNTTDILPDCGGYIEVTITDNTTPSLADLLGQPFGGGSTPVVPFYPPIAFVIFAVLIAAATVIYLKRRKLVTD
jgi:hypothetical protein